MAKRPPELRAREYRAALEKLVGSYTGMVVVLLIAGLVSVNWFAEGLRDLCLAPFQDSSQRLWIRLLLQLAVFPCVVLILFLAARRARRRVRPFVRQIPQPRQTKALILFLSPCLRDNGLVEQVLQDQLSGDLSDPQFRARFGEATWRMPLEALAHHAREDRNGVDGRLKEVVVITSADRKQQGRSDSSGTWHDLERFVHFVEKLQDSSPSLSSFGVRGLQTVIDEAIRAGRMIRPPTDYACGVDAENIEALVDAFNDGYEALWGRDIPDHEILTDITGGQKVNSVAAAIVAVGEDRLFQYVSTHDYRVCVYDVTYQP